MRMTKKRRVYETVRRLGILRPCLLVTNGDLVQETVNYAEKLVMMETVPFQRIIIVYNFGGKRGDLRRLNNLLKDKFGKSPLISIHAVAYKILTRYLRKMYRGNVQPVLAVGTKRDELARAAMGMAGIELDLDKLAEYLKKVKGAKAHLFYPPFSGSLNTQENEFFRFFEAYEKILRQKKYFDYEDIVGHAFAALRDNSWLLEEFRFKYRHIISYNYQQLTYAQKSLIALLSGQGKEVGFYAVGSDDYQLLADDWLSWKGSIREFKKDYPWGEIIIGDPAPKTTKQIAQAAYNIIKNKPNRIMKNDLEYLSKLPDGKCVSTQISDNAVSELQYVIHEVKRLLAKGISPKDIGLIFYNPKYIGVFARFLKELDIPYSGQTKRMQHCIDEGVVLTSLSMVKNQFYDYVFLIGLDIHISDLKEDRLNGIFIGMTRAQKKLYLTMAKERKGSETQIKDQEIIQLFSA